MLATNSSPGLSQFSVNLLHNSEPVDLRNCSPPNGINQSFSPKSIDENVSGSSATTASSPSTTPALTNNNNNNNHENNESNNNPNNDGVSKNGPGSNESEKKSADNIFENLSLLTQGGNFWNSAIGGGNDPQQQQALMDAAIYAMAAQQQQQPMNASLRDPEMLQQLLKQHALVRQFQQQQPGGGNGSMQQALSSMQLNRQRALNSQQQQAIASSSSNNNNNASPTPMKPSDSMSTNGKSESGSSSSADKKRGYPYTFQYCVLCQKNVHSSKLPCHIRQCHVGKPMFQCPACDFTSTYSKNNVKSHMVSLHGITGDPISYMDEYAEQVEEYMKKCFPNVRGRARPFPGRTTQNNNNNNNNNSNNSNRNNPIKSRSRHSTTTSSPKINNERNPASQNVSPSSLLQLPKFPFFNNAISQNNCVTEKPQEKVVYEIKKEEIMPDFEIKKFKKESVSNKVIQDFLTSSFEPEKSESYQPPTSLIENEHAIYTHFPHQFVSSSQIKGTVFETFTNSSDLIDRIDLTEMAVFFENNNRSLLNSEQIKIVSEVRRQLPKKDFEIMFALYKCDTSLLSLTQINLIKTIAPSEIDVRRFKIFCETNSVSSLSDEEKFVIELSNIEQLFTRLQIMEMAHNYPEMIFSLQQEINTLRDVATTLRSDTFFTTILQCSIIYINFLCGDFGAQLIHGIRVEEALKVCKYELPNGIKIGKRISDMLPITALSDTLAKRLKLYQDACQCNFSTLESRVKKLGDILLQIEAERSNLGIDSSSTSVGIAVEEARLREALTTAQNEMTATLQYFAEQSSLPTTDPIKPESFIKNVTELLLFLLNVV